jgi:GntR family transcriptional regulator
MYDVTRMTARQAVEVLKTEGLVRSEHGRGVFVRQRPTIHRLARNRFGRAYRETGKGAYDVEMRQLGLVPRTELIEIGPVDPPEDAAKRLELLAPEEVLVGVAAAGLVGWVGGRPVGQPATTVMRWRL